MLADTVDFLCGTAIFVDCVADAYLRWFRSFP